MNAWTCLAFPGETHAELLQHLYPGDGLEAAAVLVCAPTPGPRFRLVVQTLVKVPHEACKRRTATAITWPSAYVEKAIAIGEDAGLVLIPIHSHPGGLFDFSETDDLSDRELLPLIFAAYGQIHGSAIMTPDGAVRARLYDSQLTVTAVDAVMSVGDDIRIWWLDGATLTGPPSRPVAFTSGMTAELSLLTAAVKPRQRSFVGSHSGEDRRAFAWTVGELNRAESRGLREGGDVSPPSVLFTIHRRSPSGCDSRE